jgi:hypothetical protein
MLLVCWTRSYIMMNDTYALKRPPSFKCPRTMVVFFVTILLFNNLNDTLTSFTLDMSRQSYWRHPMFLSFRNINYRFGWSMHIWYMKHCKMSNIISKLMKNTSRRFSKHSNTRWNYTIVCNFAKNNTIWTFLQYNYGRRPWGVKFKQSYQ